MDIIDKNKNQNIQIGGYGKTMDAAVGGPYSKTKITDEKSITSSFPSSLVHFSSTTAKDNNNNAASLSEESKVTEKTTNREWSIFPIDQKPPTPIKDDKEKKITDSSAISKTMNDIAKVSPPINTPPTIVKDSDKISIPIQKNNDKIKSVDAVITEPKDVNKSAKKWWSIFSIDGKSQVPPKDDSKNDKEKKITDPGAISKTINNIGKSPVSVNFPAPIVKNSEKPSVPIQKDSEKIKPADFIKEVSYANTKVTNKNPLPSPFLDFSSPVTKDKEKLLDNDKLSVSMHKDIEKTKPADSIAESSYANTKTADEKISIFPSNNFSPTATRDNEKKSVPIQKDSEKIKPADSLPTEAKVASKATKKWWSIFSIGEKSQVPLNNEKDDKEKNITNFDVISKVADNIEKPATPPISIGGNEIVKNNTDQKALDENSKSRSKESCIKVDQLRVIYNKGKSNEVRSLDGVDVEIYPEEYIIIYGPSGCGKSTLLYGISGLQAPTYGDVTVLGKNIAQMTKREKVEFHQTKIGMVFQAFYLIETLTVLDNVCLPKVFRGEGLKERREKAMDLLRRFSIAEQADKFPAQLSGGQKQRVSIARALVNNPEIILADEPVGNLDSESAQNVLDIFKEINETDKKTLIMVTHNPEHLVYADRIIHMKDGKKVREEINTDKRPKEAIEKEIALTPDEISSELKLLMRTFKNLSLQQIGVLLIPFKAKQVINHILSALKEEQITAAENFLKELLFKNINDEDFEQKLDLDLSKGGAGWNKLRAISFTHRVKEILDQSEILKTGEEDSIIKFTDYLIKLYNLKVDDEIIIRFRNFVKLRVENKIDRFGLQQRIDAPKALGGIGLYKGSAEKVVDEVELIMLLKYSEQ